MEGTGAGQNISQQEEESGSEKEENIYELWKK